MYQQHDLVYLMQRLRDPQGGCPWDARQDFASLARYTLEEAYELVETIESGDMAAFEEELGDLLFQVVFHSQVAREQGLFDFSSVIHRLVTKLVSRHPHVFPDGKLYGQSADNRALSSRDIQNDWSIRKAQERERRGETGLFANIPLTFPAMLRAEKLQKRLARKGIDWPAVEPVLVQLREEIDELEQAWRSGDSEAIEHELGDVFFSTVNLARKMNTDAEGALRQANRRFVARCEYIEAKLGQQHMAIDAIDQKTFDQLWDEAKHFLSCD